MPFPRRTTVLSFVGFVAVLSLAIYFRPQNHQNVELNVPFREFADGTEEYENTIGIDLGRTYSRVGIFRYEDFEIISDGLGRDVVPSYVAFPDDGSPRLGFDAMDQAANHPKTTVYDATLLLGRSFSEPDLKDVVSQLAYDVVNRDGKPLIKMNIKGVDTYIHPEEIVAKIFGKLKAMAEKHVNGTVVHAVVAVPSHFDDAQRQATRDAGTIAGLHILRVVNEPTAAGIAYGLKPNYDEEFFYLTFNLGAKESHLALQSVECGVYETLAQAVDTSLGRDRLANMQTPSHEYRNRMLHFVEKALEDAKMKKGDVSKVLVTGDRSHVAKVQPLIEEYFGGSKCSFSNYPSPEQVVVRGVAIQGQLMAASWKDDCPSMYDVTPLSLGIETSGGVFTKIISRNTVIPTRKTHIFSTATDNQEKIEIKILEGERAISSKNKLLGTLVLDGLSPRPRGIRDIEVTLELDPTQNLKVTLRDKESVMEKTLLVKCDRERHSLEEADEIIAESEIHWEEDQLVLKAALDKVNDVSEEDLFGVIAK